MNGQAEGAILSRPVNDAVHQADSCANGTGGQRYGLIFPGQGAQRSGMGERWRDTEQWLLVEEVSQWTGYDVGELLLYVDDETLRRTDLAQLSIFTMSLLALDYLRTRFDGPVSACAGHSLGEYTALVAASALTPRAGALLVAARGAAMRAAAREQPGTMVAVLGADGAVVEQLTAAVRAEGEQVWVANYNGPRQIVVSGTPAGVDAMVVEVKQRRWKAVRLPVGGAFHTPLMATAAPLLRDALTTTAFGRPTVPVPANVDARPYTPTHWRQLAERQLTEPVRWTAIVRALTGEHACTRFIEVGPGRTLAKAVERGQVAHKVTSVGYPGDDFR